MTIQKQSTGKDKWSNWITERRFGSNDIVRAGTVEALLPRIDRVLDQAYLKNGDTLLDVGTGDGIVGFRALEREPKLKEVVFLDISNELINICAERAEQLEITQSCRFVVASAENLEDIPSESVDAVTTRSVLIYLNSKQNALAEIFRVLKPGGCLSMLEPINRFAATSINDTTIRGYDLNSLGDAALKVNAALRDGQPWIERLSADPMLNFDERDLLGWLETVGFSQIDLSLEIEINPSIEGCMDWNTFFKQAPNPNAHSLEEAVALSLSLEEATQFIKDFKTITSQRCRRSTNSADDKFTCSGCTSVLKYR